MELWIRRDPVGDHVLALLRFRVGPFQFAIAARALGDPAERSARTVQIGASELVPTRYHHYLDQGPPIAGLDTLMLKGGRLEIHGCQCVDDLVIDPTQLITRGPRVAAPWILGILHHPPCLVLDPDAMQLRFAHRGGTGHAVSVRRHA